MSNSAVLKVWYDDGRTMNMQLSENVTLITHTNIYIESMLFLYFIMLYNGSSLGFASDLELCIMH